MADKDNDPPFGGVNDPDFGPRENPSRDDPFGAEADDDPFGAKADDDPFGAKADDDPFGAKADDDSDGLRLDRNDALDFEPLQVARPEQSSSRVGLWMGIGLVVALGLGGAAAWVMLGGEMEDRTASTTAVPLVTADVPAMKSRPETPGGMEVPDRDKLVYDRVGGEEEPRVERLLPGPDEPMPAPEPAPGPRPALPQATGGAPAPDAQPVAPVEASRLPDPDPFTAPPPPLGPDVDRMAKLAPPAPAAPDTSAMIGQPAAPPAPEPAVPAEAAPGTSPAEAVVAERTQTTPPAAPANSPAFPTVSAGGDYAIQVAAVRDETRANQEWDRLKKANSDLLGSLDLNVVRADLGDKGIFYRLRAGPLASRGDAKTLCDALAERKIGCLVVKR